MYLQNAVLALKNTNNGKIVLSVGAALRNSYSCPRLALGLSSFVLFVFLLSLQCLCDALVMSQACPQVSTYSLCCLCQDFFQAEGFSKDLQRKSERLNTFLNMSFSLIAIGKTFETQNSVLCAVIFKIYWGTERTVGPLPKVFSLSRSRVTKGQNMKLIPTGWF